MARYMGQRIIDGDYEYTDVVRRRPELRAGIDAYLTEKNREDLIVKAQG